MNFMMTYFFYQKERKFKNLKKFITNLYYKNEYVIHIKFKTSIKSWINFEENS